MENAREREKIFVYHEQKWATRYGVSCLPCVSQCKKKQQQQPDKRQIAIVRTKMRTAHIYLLLFY